jgi:hypothetical protein
MTGLYAGIGHRVTGIRLASRFVGAQGGELGPHRAALCRRDRPAGSAIDHMHLDADCQCRSRRARLGLCHTAGVTDGRSGPPHASSYSSPRARRRRRGERAFGPLVKYASRPATVLYRQQIRRAAMADEKRAADDLRRSRRRSRRRRPLRRHHQRRRRLACRRRDITAAWFTAAGSFVVCWAGSGGSGWVSPPASVKGLDAAGVGADRRARDGHRGAAAPGGPRRAGRRAARPRTGFR